MKKKLHKILEKKCNNFIWKHCPIVNMHENSGLYVPMTLFHDSGVKG